MVEKVDTIDSNKHNLEKKIEDVVKKIYGTSKFIVTQGFKRGTKVNSDAKMTEILKKLSAKKKVENAVDLGDKNREKVN